MKVFIVTFFALSAFFMLPIQSTASEAKSAFQSLGECERKFVQDFLKVERYYHSSIDGAWGKGTEKAIVKYANGRSVSNIIKRLGKCLPGGARLSNAYSLMPKVSDNLRSYHYEGNKNFAPAYTSCLNELPNLLETNKIKVKSYNDIVNLFVECLAGKGQIRVEEKMFNTILDEMEELGS
jgi:hypothetical protein|tara:strand:+ start:319 stop:858 length:540 start_codon:yes stop_codon:yes gene_type:complete